MKNFKVFRVLALRLQPSSGMSLVQVMVVTALAAIASAAVVLLLQFHFKMTGMVDDSLEVFRFRAKIGSVVVSPQIIEASVAGAADIQSCLGNTSTCPGPGISKDLSILAADGSMMYDASGTDGFTERGQKCTGVPAGDCKVQLKFSYQVICLPADCNGKTKLEIFGEVKRFPTGISATTETLARFNRFWSVDGAPPLVPPGLSVSMQQVSYLNSDGSLWSFGRNYYGFIINSAPDTFVSVPQQVLDSTGAPIFARANAENGSGHTMLVRDDGTVWSIGYNGTGDLGQAGSTIVANTWSPRSVQLNEFDGVGRIFFNPAAVTYLPRATVTPSSVADWRPVTGPLGDPTVANVEKIIAGVSSFNLAVRANGEIWGVGHNAGNRMGFRLAHLPPATMPTYPAPYSTTRTYHPYWDRFPDNTDLSSILPNFTAADYGAILGQHDAQFRTGGGPVVATVPPSHPKFPVAGPMEVPGLVLEFQKSFYLGRDVGLDLKSIVVGSEHGCGINQFNNVVCWGRNYMGVLGRGTLKDDIDLDNALLLPWSPGTPGHVEKNTSKYLSAGRVGAGSFTGGFFQSPWKTAGGLPLLPPLIPTPADFHNVLIDKIGPGTPLGGVVQLSGAAGTVCALQNTGKVFCWGNNMYGEAGRGRGCYVGGSNAIQRFLDPRCYDMDIAMPVEDFTATVVTNAVKVVASGRRIYVITADGKLWAAGYQNPALNYNLGVGTGLAYYNRLREITAGGSLGFVVDVATTILTGGSMSCALNSLQEIWCWGQNHTGNPLESRFIENGAPTYPTPVNTNMDLVQ